MAIKVKGSTVIQDNQRAQFNLVNFGSYSDADLSALRVRGESLGDTVYNFDLECTMSWNGNKWVNSIVGAVQNSSYSTYVATFAISEPSHCRTIGAIPLSPNSVGGRRNCVSFVESDSQFTFLATLKLDNPDADMWVSWSNREGNVYTNKVGTRNLVDFPESTYPAGYSQKQLQATGNPGSVYYTQEESETKPINEKTLVYGSQQVFQAVESLYQTETFTREQVHPISGNFEINYDDVNDTYSFDRSFYSESNERTNSEGRAILDANGDLVVNGQAQKREETVVHLGFLGSAKNGQVFNLVDVKKEENISCGQTFYWDCPENESLVGFFYVVKETDYDLSISQPIEVLSEDVERASYFSSMGNVGNVVETAPGKRLYIRINNFNEDLTPGWPGEQAKWTMRYAVWSVS